MGKASTNNIDIKGLYKASDNPEVLNKTPSCTGLLKETHQKDISSDLADKQRRVPTIDAVVVNTPKAVADLSQDKSVDQVSSSYSDEQRCMIHFIGMTSEKFEQQRLIDTETNKIVAHIQERISTHDSLSQDELFDGIRKTIEKTCAEYLALHSIRPPQYNLEYWKNRCSKIICSTWKDDKHHGENAAVYLLRILKEAKICKNEFRFALLQDLNPSLYKAVCRKPIGYEKTYDYITINEKGDFSNKVVEQHMKGEDVYKGKNYKEKSAAYAALKSNNLL